MRSVPTKRQVMADAVSCIQVLQFVQVTQIFFITQPIILLSSNYVLNAPNTVMAYLNIYCSFKQYIVPIHLAEIDLR